MPAGGARRADRHGLRVPTPGASVVDLTCRLEEGAKYDDLAAAIEVAAAGDREGVLDWTDEDVASTDYASCQSSSIFDVAQAPASGTTT